MAGFSYAREYSLHGNPRNPIDCKHQSVRLFSSCTKSVGALPRFVISSAFRAGSAGNDLRTPEYVLCILAPILPHFLLYRQFATL